MLIFNLHVVNIRKFRDKLLSGNEKLRRNNYCCRLIK